MKSLCRMSDGLAPQDEGGDDHIKKLVKEVVEELPFRLNRKDPHHQPPLTMRGSRWKVAGSKCIILQ